MKKLIVMMGLQGVGKSTISSEFAKKHNVTYLTVDTMESAIIRSKLASKRTFECGLAAYLVAEVVAEENLKLGNAVIIDAGNYVDEAREVWQKLSERTNAKLLFVECILEESEHKKRIRERCMGYYAIDDVTWEDVEKRKSETTEYLGRKLILDTSDNVEVNVEKIAIES